MSAATHYPMLAAQATAHVMQTRPSTCQEAERGRNAMLAHIKAGTDSMLPVGLNTRSYKVSTYLGECDRSSQAMLFEACAAAMADRGSEEVKAKVVAFVHAVAHAYGEDSADFWGEQ